MSSLRDKEAILQQVDAIAKQNAPKKDHNISFSAALDKVTGVEKAFLYQEMGMPPEMIQQMMQQSPPPTQVLDIQASQAGEQAKAQGEQMRLQGQMQADQQKMQLEREKGQMDMQKAQLDMQVAEKKAQGDLQSVALKGQVEQQKAQASMQQTALQGQVAEKQASMDMQSKKADMRHQTTMNAHERKMAKKTEARPSER
jgi:hypothetical protein